MPSLQLNQLTQLLMLIHWCYGAFPYNYTPSTSPSPRVLFLTFQRNTAPKVETKKKSSFITQSKLQTQFCLFKWEVRETWFLRQGITCQSAYIFRWDIMTINSHLNSPCLYSFSSYEYTRIQHINIATILTSREKFLSPSQLRRVSRGWFRIRQGDFCECHYN